MPVDRSTPAATAIEAALTDLACNPREPRGPRQKLMPYIGQIRELLAAGRTRREIIGTLKAHGFTLSPALLRDLLDEGAHAKPKSAKPKKPSPTAPMPAFASGPATPVSG